MSPVTFLMVLLAAPPALSVAVEGTTTCPTPAEVTTRLQTLLPRLDPWDAIEHAHLVQDGVVLRVTLVDAKGTQVAERLLPSSASCTALADAAALVIAAWKSDVHAQFAVDLPAVTPPHPPPPTLTRTAAAPAAPGLLTPPAARAPDLELLLGAGISAAGPGSQPAPSAGERVRPWGAAAPAFVARAIYMPARSLGGDLFASFESDRTFGLAAGQVSWQRWAAGAGLQGQLVSRWLRLAAGADLALARVTLSGSGFLEDFSRTGWTPGATAQVRLALPSEAPGIRPSLWWEIGAAYWWRPEEARVDPAGPTAQLPRLTLSTTIGVSLGRVR
jgi:hypothetical protein